MSWIEVGDNCRIQTSTDHSITCGIPVSSMHALYIVIRALLVRWFAAMSISRSLQILLAAWGALSYQNVPRFATYRMSLWPKATLRQALWRSRIPDTDDLCEMGRP